MAPKDGTSSPRKTTSRQTKLSFKPTKRDAAPLKAKTKSKSKQAKPPPSDSESESSVSGINETSGANADPAVLDVHDKARRYKRYYDETRALMNHKAPIHFKDQPKVYQMLRVFDNTYDFGPCVGMTRLERWERAETLGLNPPPEVREILLTEQGRRDPELVHPVFYGQVL